jgi:hypothetical protein
MIKDSASRTSFDSIPDIVYMSGIRQITDYYWYDYRADYELDYMHDLVHRLMH